LSQTKELGRRGKRRLKGEKSCFHSKKKRKKPLSARGRGRVWVGKRGPPTGERGLTQEERGKKDVRRKGTGEKEGRKGDGFL